jgi:threonyl-tRNA synthetase
MNCPFHIAIYKSEIRSYRDLPIRYAEYGNVYRYELSGALAGMTRVRGFTQDDAHILCTPDQIEEEVARALKFSLYVLRTFGLKEFAAYVSTKPGVKSIGSDEDWEMATEILKKAVLSAGLTYEIDEGGGAFYGPKIDIKLKDVLNREWQCSTIQFDFNLPQRFEVTYIGKDGKAHTPYMVHRALFGSIERFAALLIGHYKGEFPLWLAPVQLGIVPIKASHNDYCKGLEVQLKKRGFRVAAEYEDMHMREKIKRFELEKIPLVLVVGDKEVEQNCFSVRSRAQGNIGSMTIEQLLACVHDDLAQGEPQYIFGD